METRARRWGISPPVNLNLSQYDKYNKYELWIWMFFVLAYDIMIPMWNISNSNIHVFIPWHLVRSILGRRLELQGTLGLISWSGRTMAYTWMSSILSELSQITRESFTLLISSSWKGKVYESILFILVYESWELIVLRPYKKMDKVWICCHIFIDPVKIFDNT